LLVSNNVAYQRAAFEDLGGFDESFLWAEDRDLSIRMLAAHHRQMYCPQARVWHDQVRPSAWGYMRQQFRYGRGAHLLERKLARIGLTQRFSALTRQNRPFRQALWRSLRAQRASPGMWLLINAGQLSHRLGKYYGALRA
jgi:GT2 family glycosyltransferase